MTKTVRRNRALMDTPFFNKLLTSTILFTALAFSASSQAADKLFDLILSAQPDAITSGSGGTGVVGQVSFPSVLGDDISVGDEYDIALPGGTSVSAEVIMNSGTAPVQGHGEEFLSASTDSKVLALGDSFGSLEVHLIGNAVAGITLNDTDNGKIYRARIDGNGTGDLAEIDPNSILCLEMPTAPDEEVSEGRLARIPAGLTVELVSKLESRPGATNTVFIDNWGGTFVGPEWNGGVPINYTPYSNDDDTTSFSQVDINYIWLAWAEMAEDYADFDVNITTNTGVYNNAPVANRSRIISTTTCAWFDNCGAGGVAYVGVFNLDQDAYKTGWTWNRTPGSVGMTHSHEAGHQMGLSHDATSNLGYYGGHGDWGPIMGAPFNQPYVQWSKGEYPDANNQEDDLNILTSVLGQRADDVGDSPSAANELEATTGTNYTITQDGIAADTDVFAFTIGESQLVSIDVASTLGVAGEARAANAAFNVDLKNSAGTVVESVTSSDNTPLQPDTNTFSFSNTLEPDTYYLTVDAVSPDTNWTTGFGEYGHGGEYRLVADFEPGNPSGSPEITNPSPDSVLAGYTDTFNWVSNGTDVVEYWVYVGSGLTGSARYEYGTSGSLSPATLSYSPTGLPVDGSTVYVTLFWIEAGDEDKEEPWQGVQYTYTAATGSVPTFTSPVSGGTLAGVSDTFEWAENDSGATEYWLYLGSEVGARDYYNSGFLGSATIDTVEFMAADGDDTVSYLPTDGSTVYARLWYRATSSDRWLSVDDTFVAATSGGPAITSPAPGSVISSSPVTFEWESGDADVSEWWVYIGTTAGGRDIYNSGSLGTAVSVSVTIPVDGSTAHVTLWAKINGKWRSVNYVYETGSSS